MGSKKCDVLSHKLNINIFVSNLCKINTFIPAEEQTLVNEILPCEEVKSSKSFAALTMEEIGYWLVQLGLECYAGELRKWKATGQKLLDSTQNQIEKELDIKNPLHRKKLLYAIESERCHGSDFLGSDKVIKHKLLKKGARLFFEFNDCFFIPR